MLPAAVAVVATLAIGGCGSSTTVTYPGPGDSVPTPAASVGPNDHPSGPGGNPSASPPPHFCGDQLCITPSPSPR